VLFFGKAPSSKIMRQNKEMAGAISGPRRLIPDADKTAEDWAIAAMKRRKTGKRRLLGGLV
jgi:hypothetical protein